MRIERELMRGAGPLAVLKLLEQGEMYGYELVRRLAERSDGVLAMGQSTLYPLLYNLQSKGLITARWDEERSARPRKYYRLTTKGRRRLERETEQWEAVVSAMEAMGILARTGRAIGAAGRRMEAPA